MKTLSEKQALAKLRALKEQLRAVIRDGYEHRAKNCLTCATKGACCTDEHFVNVHITRLEAVLIDEELQKLPAARQKEIRRKIRRAVAEYDLTAEGDTFQRTFACPLFDGQAGCLVHAVKPVPCINHACYERKEDLPPDNLAGEAETAVERLNRRTYRKASRWLPLPVFLELIEND